jgi:hypothetical protein
MGQNITELLTKQENNTLTLPWLKYNKDTDVMKEISGTVGELSPSRIANEVRASERLKKAPVTR